MENNQPKNRRKTPLIRVRFPEEMVIRLRRGAELCGVDPHDFLRALILELAEAEMRKQEVGAEKQTMRTVGVSLPEDVVAFLTEEAKKRKLYRSQYIQGLVFGTTGAGKYFELGHGKEVNLRFTLPAAQARELEDLAVAAHVSRSQYIRDLLLGTPVPIKVFLDPDLSALEPAFQSLEIIAESMQELVLRPDRTPEEQAESRQIQKEMLSEIRRIRLEMEGWGRNTIAHLEAVFHQWKQLREEAGLLDVSDAGEQPVAKAG